MADSIRGRFVWHELMTPDPKAAASFYATVVGWVPKAYERDPSYTMLTYGDVPMGGILKHDAPRLWLPYIATPNVDATAREAVQLGGKVVKPAADIPEIGRFAILSDPQRFEFEGDSVSGVERASHYDDGTFYSGTEIKPGDSIPVSIKFLTRAREGALAGQCTVKLEFLVGYAMNGDFGGKATRHNLIAKVEAK